MKKKTINNKVNALKSLQKIKLTGVYEEDEAFVGRWVDVFYIEALDAVRLTDDNWYDCEAIERQRGFENAFRASHNLPLI
jgi:hypothetical protein